MAYHDYEDDLLPDDDEMADLAVPDSALDASSVTFDQMRHEFDRAFLPTIIDDLEIPEIAAIRNEHLSFMRL